MSEPTTTALAAGTCAASSGGFTVACLSAMGINPPDMIAGLLGCVAVMSLIKAAEPRTFRSIAMLTVGGVLLASFLAPLAAPWVVETGASWAPKVPAASLRAAVAAVIGGFAQSIVTGISARLTLLVTRGSSKEPRDA